MSAGPAVIGAVASRVGLHLALLIPLVLAAWIVVAAPALGPPGNGTASARQRRRVPSATATRQREGTGGTGARSG